MLIYTTLNLSQTTSELRTVTMFAFCNIQIKVSFHPSDMLVRCAVRISSPRNTGTLDKHTVRHHYMICTSPLHISVGSQVQGDTGCKIGVLGFDSRRGLGIFSLPSCPDRFWCSLSLLFGGYPRLFFLVIKQPGREADHSPPSSAEVKNMWIYTSNPSISLHGVVLS
jgi:hypothetical protein